MRKRLRNWAALKAHPVMAGLVPAIHAAPTGAP